MRSYLVLVLIIALEWPEVNSTGTFVGKALETQLKLLERKHGMSASAERPRKKGTSKTKTHGLDAGAQILRKNGEKGNSKKKSHGRKASQPRSKKKATSKKKTRINCKEQPLKPVCIVAKLKKLETQMKSFVQRKRVSMLETSIKSQFINTKRREDSVEAEVKKLKYMMFKLEQRVNETLERGVDFGSGSGDNPIVSLPVTPVKIN